MRALLAALLVAAVPAPAQAAAVERYVVSVNSLYVPGDQSVVASDGLTLVNLDTIAHDVAAVDTGPDGLPLFQSAVVSGPGGTAKVVGVEVLEPGIYQFYCSLHEQMRGTVTVA